MTRNTPRNAAGRPKTASRSGRCRDSRGQPGRRGVVWGRRGAAHPGSRPVAALGHLSTGWPRNARRALPPVRTRPIPSRTAAAARPGAAAPAAAAAARQDMSARGRGRTQPIGAADTRGVTNRRHDGDFVKIVGHLFSDARPWATFEPQRGEIIGVVAARSRTRRCSMHTRE